MDYYFIHIGFYQFESSISALEVWKLGMFHGLAICLALLDLIVMFGLVILVDTFKVWKLVLRQLLIPQNQENNQLERSNKQSSNSHKSSLSFGIRKTNNSAIKHLSIEPAFLQSSSPMYQTRIHYITHQSSNQQSLKNHSPIPQIIQSI